MFIKAMLVCRVFSWVCMEARLSATFPIMSVVYSILTDMESLRVFSNDVLVALDGITILWILYNLALTRVKALVKWDVVDVEADAGD